MTYEIPECIFRAWFRNVLFSARVTRRGRELGAASQREQWAQRLAEIIEGFEREAYGQITCLDAKTGEVASQESFSGVDSVDAIHVNWHPT